MRIDQFYLGCLAHASYLVSDSGEAAVVDPQRDIEIYLAAAARLGVAIRRVFLTHFHADFLAGHIELRERCGAEICLGSRAQAEYPFRALADGEELPLGHGRLRILHTPGHTPESISILVFDPGSVGLGSRGPQAGASISGARGERVSAQVPPGPEAARGPAPVDAPQAVLTGDTLFVGDVGRPDLRASLGWSARELGELLYDSLHTKLLPLPDATLVYPAHGAGSLCGKNISRETVSTLAEQRRLNYALQPMGREEFLRLVLAGQPEAPAYFTYDAVLNTREHPVLDRSLGDHLRPIPLAEAEAAVAHGAILLDVRPAADFARAHWRGAINIPLDGQFATWCGTLLSSTQPIVLLADPGAEHEAGIRLGRIGFDQLAGFLATGMAALAGRDDLLASRDRLSPAQLAAGPEPWAHAWLLDVRNENEVASGHIPGSLAISLARLSARRAELPPPGQPIVVYCQGGYRSSIAASLLSAWGHTPVADLDGGYAAWRAAQG